MRCSCSYGRGIPRIIMKQDVDAGRPTELDAFLGALIRKTDLCGLEVPAAREYYRALSGKS